MGIQTHVVCHHLDGIHGHYLDLFQETSVVTHVLDKQALAAGTAFAKKNSERVRTLRDCPVPRLHCLLFLGCLIGISPDILHCYLDIANCVGGCAGLVAGVPGIVLSCRNLNPLSVGFDAFEYLLHVYRFLHVHPSVRMEANSARGAADYAGWINMPATEITVNPNGINPMDFAMPDPFFRNSVRRSLDTEDDAPLVLYISRHVAQKRAGDMAAVAALLRGRIPGAQMLAAGIGLEEDGEFGAYIREQGLSGSVRLLGIRKDIPNLLAAADALLLTSQAEGFPNAVMEAMCAGLPVVSTDVGGVPELVVHGVTGFLHPVGDVWGMAESLALLLGDSVLRKKMGENGRSRIHNSFTVDKLVERTIGQYVALLGSVNAVSALNN
jgi:glycosyltransferase involved in cell wall biosynthesis